MESQFRAERAKLKAVDTTDYCLQTLAAVVGLLWNSDNCIAGFSDKPPQEFLKCPSLSLIMEDYFQQRGGKMNFQSATTSQPFPQSSSYRSHFKSKPVRKRQPPVVKDGKRSALIVDDVPDIASMLAVYLERAGYRAVSVFSASEALDAARHEHFDVIISDIGLPVMDGYELARELRALPDYATTPLIAVTGFSEYTDQQNAFNAGFDAHLKKPIDPTKLIGLIEHLVC